MYLYITRHGLTKWNEEGRLQGHADSPLVEQGIQDALSLKEYIKQYPIERVYSSPLLRAYQTATLIFDDQPIIKDERLKEMSFGIYEGLKVKKLLNDPIYYALWNTPEKFERIQNGESYQEVFQRLNDFLEDLKKQPVSHVFITIHGMLYVVLMGIIKNLEVKDLPKINHHIIRGGSLTIVEMTDHSFNIIEEGTSHFLVPLKQTTVYKSKKVTDD